MVDDELLYAEALGRIYKGMKWLAAGGALAALPFLGGLWSLAFLLGAAVAYLNFTWLHQVVDALAPGAQSARKRVYLFVAIRYLFLGAAGYVIVKVFGMNVIATLSGLFIPAGAVIVEILYELVHDRT
jgi:hypothetical protein